MNKNLDREFYTSQKQNIKYLQHYNLKNGGQTCYRTNEEETDCQYLLGGITHVVADRFKFIGEHV